MLKRTAATVALSVLAAVSAAADDFKGVAPPPELGETLTSYRTREQLIEQAVRDANGERTNPRIKIYRKNADGTPDYDHPVEQEAGATADVSGIRQISSAPVPSGRAVKTMSFDYMGQKQLALKHGERYILTVKDGDGVVWPIDHVEMSNPAFRAAVTNEQQVVVDVLSNAQENSMASLRIVPAGGEKNRELHFVLSLRNGHGQLDYNASVRVPYKSPNNMNGDGGGTTNMTLSAKSRNSRREVGGEPSVKLTPKAQVADNSKENTASSPANAAVAGAGVLVVTSEHGLGFDFLKNMGITVLGQRLPDLDGLERISGNLVGAAQSLKDKPQGSN